MNKKTYTYPDGTTYEGEWKSGKRHGHGVWTKPDGIKYAGKWENDKPNGHGSLTFPGGKKYIGEWKDGKMHGKGIEIHPDRTKIYGEWENDELIEGRLPEPDQKNQELRISNRGHKVKTRAELLITPKAKQYRNRPIIWLVSVVVVLLLAVLFALIYVGVETYSISGQVVNYSGEGIDGVIINFGEEFEATKTDEKGYWSKSDLRGEVTVTPQYGRVVFYPIRSEVSKPNDEVSFTLFKEMGEGITSSSGEYVFSSNLTEEEQVEITVLVEDFKTGDQLEDIAVEVVVSGDTIEILLQDNKGEYLPEIIVLEMEHLENYPGVEVRKGSLLLLVKTTLLAKPYLEWAIENPREASAVAAIGVAGALDVYELVSYAAGGIAIATGAGALPGAGAIATGFATNVASKFLNIYAASVFADKEKTDHSITIYIFESRKSAQHTKLLVPAGTNTDEIVEAIESVVGNREFEIEVPENNPAGAYYNDDGTPKFFHVYLKESQRELVAEPEPEYIVLVNVDVLHLRSGPGTDHDILGKLVLGTALRVVGQQNEWLQVVTPEEKNGWIHSDYVISQNDEKRSIINKSREPYMCFFNGGYEFGLEPIGLSAGMSVEKAIGILGEPLARENNEEGLRGPTTELVYDGLMLGFYNSPELNDSSLSYYRIFSPEFFGKRGICVGDTAESVMSKYLKDYEKEIDECIEKYKCVEMYYLEADDGSVQSGMYHRDQNTGEIINISYWHGVPQSCAGSSIKYTIENGLVKAIQLD